MQSAERMKLIMKSSFYYFSLFAVHPNEMVCVDRLKEKLFFIIIIILKIYIILAYVFCSIWWISFVCLHVGLRNKNQTKLHKYTFFFIFQFFLAHFCIVLCICILTSYFCSFLFARFIFAG